MVVRQYKLQSEVVREMDLDLEAREQDSFEETPPVLFPPAVVTDGCSPS